MIETVALSIDDIIAAVRQRRAFDKGLAPTNVRRRAELEASTARVRTALDIDILEGKCPRGRAGRIARRLQMQRRTVQRILDTR
jgi:ActR/RegA family two-component response regulator